MLLAAIGLVALDIRAHKRVESVGGVNVWGYRGTVLHEKQANEIRIAVVGGDLAFGWGVAADETLAAYLRRLVILDLDRAGGANRLVTAVNLGGAGSRRRRVRRMARTLCVSRAGRDLHRAGPRLDICCERDDSCPIGIPLAFVAFGYSPILPLVLQERGSLGHSAVMQESGRLLARADVNVSSAAAPRADARESIRATVAAAARVARHGRRRRAAAG